TSLGEWMISNLGEGAIENYWSEKNSLSPWEIGKGSNKKIWIRCQIKEYHEDYAVTPNDFARQTCRCPYCRSLKIHPKDSFAQWCVENLDKNFIENFWSDKNEVDPWKTAPKTNRTKIWIRDQESNECYETNPFSFAKSSSGTKMRGRLHSPKYSFAQWGIDRYGDDFLDKYWSIENVVNPWIIGYGSRKEIWLNCLEKDYHEPYKVPVSRFTIQESRCPYCAVHGRKKVHYLDSLGVIYPDSASLWSDKNKKSPFELTPKSEQFAYWRCENEIHNDYNRMIKSSNNYDFRCPACVNERSESFPQGKVRLFLSEDLKYQVNHEHLCEIKCINPKTNHVLPYDNEVIINEKDRLIIEVQGQQHYYVGTWAIGEANRKGITPNEELEYRQWKDRFKMEYALSQGYYYLALHYREFKNDSWKSLIVNKLNEIKLEGCKCSIE
ncbi:MAG: zinc-ribbon domain-containing protein, partial [Candidatus Paceibacterota bacterium]